MARWWKAVGEACADDLAIRVLDSQTRRVEMHGARILAMQDGEIFSCYLPTPKGPVFMTLIQKTFGKDQTTRTWDTIAKVAR